MHGNIIYAPSSLLASHYALPCMSALLLRDTFHDILKSREWQKNSSNENLRSVLFRLHPKDTMDFNKKKWVRDIFKKREKWNNMGRGHTTSTFFHENITLIIFCYPIYILLVIPTFHSDVTVLLSGGNDRNEKFSTMGKNIAEFLACFLFQEDKVSMFLQTQACWSKIS